MKDKTAILEQIIHLGLLGLIFVLPLFFLPFTAEFYEFNKNILLAVACLLFLALWMGKMVLAKKVTLRRSPFDLPIILFAAVVTASTILVSPNKIEAILLPGATGTVLALTALYFLLTNNLSEKQAEQAIKALLISATLLALITIYQFIGIGEALISANSFWVFLKPKFWTPAGGLLALGSFLLTVFILAALQIWKKRVSEKQPLSASSLSEIISLLILAGGLGVTAYQLFISAKTILLPPSAGWAIAIETLKSAPILGLGLSNFLSAFTAFRPIAFNATDLWSFRFTSSSNWYFHLLATVGVLGLGTIAFLIFRVITSNLKTNRPVFVSLVVIFLILALIPSSFLLIFTLYLLLAILAVFGPKQEIEETSRLLPWTFFIPTLAVVLVAFYFIGRAYAAELVFRRSILALNQNQGLAAYNFQIQAISLNPYQSNFRLAYSQTNFALANALAANKDLSDQDRQNISILIQQSIREAKAAVSLNSRNVIAWENLANTYRALINFAEGANDWTIAAYQQAIALDPLNPNLRLSLGGVYFALGQYDEAVKWFEQVVNLKPNFANGHYNLSAAYREKGDFARATGEMETTLSLIPRDSDDWKKAISELEALKKKLGEKAEKEAQKSTESLSPPQPLPTGIKPPLTLPTGAEPEISPTPSPEATPTP